MLRRGDGQRAEVEDKRLRGLDAAALPAVIDALGRWLDAGPGEAGSGPVAVARLEHASGGVVRAAGGEDRDRDGTR